MDQPLPIPPTAHIGPSAPLGGISTSAIMLNERFFVCGPLPCGTLTVPG